MIDVSEIVLDPDFAQSFTIRRNFGQWVKGVFQTLPGEIQSYGVIQRANEKDLEMLPEGDRVRGAISIWSTQPLLITHAGDSPTVSDIVIWHGEEYRVASLAEWQDHGYYRAVAVRIAGQ